MGKKKGERSGEKNIELKDRKKSEKKAEKKRLRKEKEKALEARILSLEQALAKEKERKLEHEPSSSEESKASEVHPRQTQEADLSEQDKREANAVEQEMQELDAVKPNTEEAEALDEKAWEQEAQEPEVQEPEAREPEAVEPEVGEPEEEKILIEETSERKRGIPVFVEERSSAFPLTLSPSQSLKELLLLPGLVQGEIREYLSDPEEAMEKERDKTNHRSTFFLFCLGLFLVFLIGLYLSNGNPKASLQFSFLYALSFLLLPFFLLLFFSEGRAFSSLFYLFTRGRLALTLLAALSFVALLLGFPLFSIFLFLLGIPLGIVLDFTALKIEYGQSRKVLKICFLYSVFALSLFLFFGFCFIGFSMLNYILGRLWEGNLNLKGFLEFLLSHFPE